MLIDSDNATFCSDGMGLGDIDFTTGSLDDNNFDDDDDDDDDDPETIVFVRPVAWCKKYNHRKACEKEISTKLIPLAWHSRRW